ncbi:MAG: hypothetical protein WBW98_14135, partial [Candidatus Sulfotelmatobacter sp.]
MARSAECNKVALGIIAGGCETVGGGLPGSTSNRTIDSASHRDTVPAAAGPRTTPDQAGGDRAPLAQDDT